MSILILLPWSVTNKLKISLVFNTCLFFLCYLSEDCGSAPCFSAFHVLRWKSWPCLEHKENLWQKFPVPSKASAQTWCCVLANFTGWSLSSPITLGQEGRCGVAAVTSLPSLVLCMSCGSGWEYVIVFREMKMEIPGTVKQSHTRTENLC